MDTVINWEAVGAAGEILGALAVVATLAYLAVQIRQNTKASRSAVRQAIAQMTMASASDLASDSELAEIMVREVSVLTSAERLRLMTRTYVAMRNWENIHYQYLAGMLESDEWAGFRLNLKSLLNVDLVRDYWAEEQQYYSEAFRTEVERIQRELALDNVGQQG